MSDKPAEQPADTTGSNPVGAEPPFRSAAELAGMTEAINAKPRPGLSFSPGLEEVPDSVVPGVAGTSYSHVMGPQQSAVDPYAAGLDVRHKPLTRNDNRIVTRTGEDAAGPRPATHIEKTGPQPDKQVAQAAPADGALVRIPPETESDAAPGPTAAAATQTV